MDDAGSLKALKVAQVVGAEAVDADERHAGRTDWLGHSSGALSMALAWNPGPDRLFIPGL